MSYLFVLLALWPWGGEHDRIRSMDGQWLLPVASPMLGSDEKDHRSRGSINAWANHEDEPVSAEFQGEMVSACDKAVKALNIRAHGEFEEHYAGIEKPTKARGDNREMF